MARRKMQIGICKLCKKKTKLSFEHIPPKVAFNKYTKYRSVPYIEYIQNSINQDYKPSGKLMQGGLGEYCLCRNCNSFLGNLYVPTYERMAVAGKILLSKGRIDNINFEVQNLAPLKLLKQVISMFICINRPNFTEAYPELLSFVCNPSQKTLPEKYRVYMYLNCEGKTRSLSMLYQNHVGLVCELTFPPLGFVLNIDNQNPIFPLMEITHFKDVDINYDGKVKFQLNVLPTHLPFPVDYRTQKQIDEAIKESEKFI